MGDPGKESLERWRGIVSGSTRYRYGTVSVSHTPSPVFADREPPLVVTGDDLIEFGARYRLDPRGIWTGCGSWVNLQNTLWDGA